MAIYAFIDLFGTLGGSGLDDIRTFKFYNFSISALQRLNNLNLKLVIVTNQSGISKGEYSLNEFEEHKNRLLNLLNRNRVTIYKFLFCPHIDLERKRQVNPVPISTRPATTDAARALLALPSPSSQARFRRGTTGT